MVYKTEQRKILLDFFDRNRDKVFSAQQIAKQLEQFDISLSAVYRNLSALEQAGKVKRQTKIGSREVYYQFVDCASCQEHIHISCTKCGKIVHLKEEQTNLIANNVLQSAHFNLDKSSTILYGVCDKCSK